MGKRNRRKAEIKQEDFAVAIDASGKSEKGKNTEKPASAL